METVTDDILLEKLKAEDNASFQALYKFYFPSIASYVKQNKGNNEDAEDVFQESIIVLLRKVRQPQLILTSALKTYLYAISKNIWLKRLRSNKLISVEEFELYQLESELFSAEIDPVRTKDEKVILWLSKITENCKRILRALFYFEESMESVMKRMGWKNKHTAANQQYKCIQQVRKEKDKEEA